MVKSSIDQPQTCISVATRSTMLSMSWFRRRVKRYAHKVKKDAHKMKKVVGVITAQLETGSSLSDRRWTRTCIILMSISPIWLLLHHMIHQWMWALRPEYLLDPETCDGRDVVDSFMDYLCMKTDEPMYVLIRRPWTLVTSIFVHINSIHWSLNFMSMYCVLFLYHLKGQSQSRTWLLFVCYAVCVNLLKCVYDICTTQVSSLWYVQQRRYSMGASGGIIALQVVYDCHYSTETPVYGNLSFQRRSKLRLMCRSLKDYIVYYLKFECILIVYRWMGWTLIHLGHTTHAIGFLLGVCYALFYKTDQQHVPNKQFVGALPGTVHDVCFFCW